MRIVTRVGLWVVVGLVALNLSLPAQSQIQNPDQLIFGFNNQQMEQIMTKKGITFQQKAVGGITLYTIKLPSGYQGVISNVGGSLLISVHGMKTKGLQTPTLDKMNDWNQTNMFCRAFVDRMGSGALQADMHTIAGTTERIIMDWLDRFDGNVKKFGQYCL